MSGRFRIVESPDEPGRFAASPALGVQRVSSARVYRAEMPATTLAAIAVAGLRARPNSWIAVLSSLNVSAHFVAAAGALLAIPLTWRWSCRPPKGWTSRHRCLGRRRSSPGAFLTALERLSHERRRDIAPTRRGSASTRGHRVASRKPRPEKAFQLYLLATFRS